jgi:hypothetical protein
MARHELTDAQFALLEVGCSIGPYRQHLGESGRVARNETMLLTAWG